MFFFLRTIQASIPHSLIIQGDKRTNTSNSPLVAQPSVIAGQDVPLNTFQYTVSLRRDGSTTAFCGGTIIAEEYVLTAAHCAMERIKYVVIGDASNRAVFDTPRSRVFGVRDLWVHPQYEQTFLNLLLYDVAIIRLDRPVPYVSRLNVPAMYLGDASPADSIAGHVGLISGWGCTEIPTDNTGACPTRVPYTMQYASTQIVTNEACRNSIVALDPKIAPLLAKISSSVVCTKSFNSQSTCFGDSGGPLVVQGIASSKGVLVGITSWGFKCGSNDLPFGFGRVSAFRDFIDTYVTGHQWTSSLKQMDFPYSGVPHPLSSLREAQSILGLIIAFYVHLLLL